uniref:Uncharacterized protein n=2 Tax=Manihot esculenta TaxID=3983 RepID=A0A2C9ULP1_MANES
MHYGEMKIPNTLAFVLLKWKEDARKGEKKIKHEKGGIELNYNSEEKRKISS